MSTPRILLVPDTRPEVGLGHASRCATLARALTGKGAICGFVASKEVWKAVDLWKAPAGISCIVAADSLDAAREFDACLVVIDGYGMPARYVAPLHNAGHRTVVIDDNGLSAIEPDLIINPNAHARSDMYTSDSLIGPHYAMIRPAFESFRAEARDYARARSIFICMGGADPSGVSQIAVEAALSARIKPHLTVVLGPFADTEIEHALKARLAKLPSAITILRAPDDFVALLARTDMAILSGGVVLTEALHLGIPCVAISIADNQRLGVAAWSNAQAIIQADPERESIRRQIERLADDAELRRRLGTTARTLVDGAGAARAAEAIMTIIHRGPSA